MTIASPPMDRGSFAGHETFPFRCTWLPKAVHAVARDRAVFGREDAMTRLGVGRNMSKSIHHWALAAGMVEEDPEIPNNRGRALRPTELGSRLFGDDGWDPYLEDPATLWVIHWKLAGTPALTTWFWAFSHLPQPELAKTELVAWLLKLSEQRGWSRVSDTSLRRDVDVFLRTYVASQPSRTVPIEDTLDCPLVELGLIRELGARGTYMVVRGEQPTLPDEVFAYALAEHLARSPDTSRTVPLDTIAFAPGSPGRVFCLSEEALLIRLDRLEHVTGGALSFDETAGLRQLLVHRAVRPLELLAAYYERLPGEGLAARGAA